MGELNSFDEELINGSTALAKHDSIVLENVGMEGRDNDDVNVNDNSIDEKFETNHGFAMVMALQDSKLDDTDNGHGNVSLEKIEEVKMKIDKKQSINVDDDNLDVIVSESDDLNVNVDINEKQFGNELNNVVSVEDAVMDDIVHHMDTKK